MSNSSAQQPYSITLDDSITITGSTQDYISSDTITISNIDVTTLDSIYIGSGGSSTIGNISITDTDFNISWGNEEWVNSFPDWDKVQDMCKHYPGLKIILEKFKTTYKLVKDEYDATKDKK